MLSLKHQPTSILFWIQGPMALACAANWRRRRSLACWRASSSCSDWSRMGTSCFTCQDSRTTGVRGQRWSRKSDQDRWWWVEGRGGSRVGEEGRRRGRRGRVLPTLGTKGELSLALIATQHHQCLPKGYVCTRDADHLSSLGFPACSTNPGWGKGGLQGWVQSAEDL